MKGNGSRIRTWGLKSFEARVIEKATTYGIYQRKAVPIFRSDNETEVILIGGTYGNGVVIVDLDL